MDKTYDISLPPQEIIQRSLGERIISKIKNRLSGASAAKYPTAHGWPAMPYNTVELVYWRPVEGVNFGDELSRTVVELMLARRGYTPFDSVEQCRSLLAIGSIIHFAKDNDVVWGSGVNGSVAEHEHRYRALDVRAVRGPLTRQFLRTRKISVPEVYGDPALLIRRLAGQRFNQRSKYSVGLVPNMFELGIIQRENLLARFPDIHLIDPRSAWNDVINEIVQCEFILASSLHGLIIADAFAIPSCYLRLSEHEGRFKYEDYYEGTGRPLRYAPSIEAALEMEPATPLRVDLDALENAFPYDLWT